MRLREFEEAESANRPIVDIRFNIEKEQPVWYKRVLFKQCKIAGISFHVKYNDELWEALEVGTKLALVRHRNNQYDRNAVAVALADDFDGDHDNFDFDFILGYVPRTANSELAAMMDAGYQDKFEATISTYYPHDKINDRITISIWLLSLEPVPLSDSNLRIQPMALTQLQAMTDVLQRDGFAHYRCKKESPDIHSIPTEGNEIIVVNPMGESVVIYHMKVIASGMKAVKFIEPDQTPRQDDGLTDYILTNIAGPFVIDKQCLAFLSDKPLLQRRVYDLLNPEQSDRLSHIVKTLTEEKLLRDCNPTYTFNPSAPGQS